MNGIIEWHHRIVRLSFVVAMFLSVFIAQAGVTGTKPNIIFILTDDMGCGDLSCYGGNIAATPNIDRLAKEGIRFTQFYVASPVCSPSRTGFLTGMFPARWRITSYLQTREGNRQCEQNDFLDPKAPSIARALKEAGYATAHIGKWHLGGGRDVTNAPPFAEYGFDEHVSTYESPEPDPNITATNWVWSADDKIKRWDRSGYFVDKTLEFLRRHPGQPCYVNLWPDDVHAPWVPEGSPLERGTTDQGQVNLKRVIEEYDRQVGRLLDGLRKLNLDENTLLIFTSDNGPLPTFNSARTGGLRGSKISLYEGGIRTPLIVRWSGHAPAGRVDKKTVMNGVDFFPIFCKVAGVVLPKSVRFDGEDLSKAFSGKSVVRKNPMFWEYGRNNRSFDYPKVLRDRSPNVAIREGKWKLLVNADGGGAELYDLEKDGNENKNIAEINRSVAKRLSEKALGWRKSLP